MATVPQLDQPRNRLLALLPPDELDFMLGVLEPAIFPFGQVLIDIDKRIEHVYFSERALLSIIGTDDSGAGVEIAMVGRDGMAGLPVYFGADRTLMQVFVQVEGTGWRLSADRFRDALRQAPGLDRLIRLYAQSLFFFTGQSSACNRLHPVMQRCARWLLTTHDAVGDDQFRLTHMVLAQMLGVRRATVTETAGALQRSGYISYNRGVMQMVNRAGLEAVSCSCYRLIRREQDRLMIGRDAPGPVETAMISAAGRSTASDAPTTTN